MYVAESSVINFSQFESVTEAFVTLTSKLTRLLRKADFHIIRRSCIEQINTPNGAQLPPQDVSASKEIKDAYYTKVVSKFNEDADDITVEDLLKLQSQLEAVIMDIKKGVCILEHLEKGCIAIFWYIPASCVDGAYRSARAKQYQFNDLHLQSLKIGHYPVVHNPLAPPDLLPTPSPPVNSGVLYNIVMLRSILGLCVGCQHLRVCIP